jgi:anti-sigma-K factor RskA
VAVSLWRQEQQDGLPVVENLPALPAGRDYQLWVIDPNPKVPVSAGVFKVDPQGKVRLEFKPIRNVPGAFKLAFTQEMEGGSARPTMDKMVVIGG